MIKPTPYKLSCEDCAWSKSFAPQSDAIMPGERPKNCPQCDSGKLKYSRVSSIVTLLSKLMRI